VVLWLPRVVAPERRGAVVFLPKKEREKIETGTQKIEKTKSLTASNVLTSNLLRTVPTTTTQILGPSSKESTKRRATYGDDFDYVSLLYKVSLDYGGGL
jgi:hypothetical protein